MIEVGRRYYFIVHAYHHFIGEVEQILGANRFALKDVVKVHSCARCWAEFFEGGLQDDTRCDRFPDGTVITGEFVAAPWGHPHR